MTDEQIVKKWRESHDVYATLDRSPTTPDKIILIKGDSHLIEQYDKMSEELLDKLLEKFKRMYE